MIQKVLITGTTGMTGTHLVQMLVTEHPEIEVFGTKRWRSDISSLDSHRKRMRLVDCDLTDASACFQLIRDISPDVIFHLAAQSYVMDSWTNPVATTTQNSLMELHLFEAIRAAKIDPVILVALSSEQYGNVYENELPIRESNPFRPLSPYAVSKVTQDMLAYQYHQNYGLRVIRTRAFNHEGPYRHESFVTSNFAKQIAEIEAGLKEPCVQVGNLEARRDWTDVRDMVRAYWLAVQHCTPGEDYVIASGVSRTVREMLQTLLDLTDVQVEIRVDPERLRPSDVRVLQGDASKFKAATGWQTEISFKQTMADLLDYWRDRIAVGTTADERQAKQVRHQHK